MKYELLTAPNALALVTTVNRFLEVGWQPLGPPGRDEQQGIYYQAITKGMEYKMATSSWMGGPR